MPSVAERVVGIQTNPGRPPEASVPPYIAVFERVLPQTNKEIQDMFTSPYYSPKTEWEEPQLKTSRPLPFKEVKRVVTAADLGSTIVAMAQGWGEQDREYDEETGKGDLKIAGALAISVDRDGGEVVIHRAGTEEETKGRAKEAFKAFSQAFIDLQIEKQVREIQNGATSRLASYKEIFPGGEKITSHDLPQILRRQHPEPVLSSA